MQANGTNKCTPDEAIELIFSLLEAQRTAIANGDRNRYRVERAYCIQDIFNELVGRQPTVTELEKCDG